MNAKPSAMAAEQRRRERVLRRYRAELLALRPLVRRTAPTPTPTPTPVRRSAGKRTH